MIKLSLTENCQFWLNSLNKKTVTQLLGNSIPAFLQTAHSYTLNGPADMIQVLLEIPLLGESGCDTSLSYSLDLFRHTGFSNQEGRKVQPLFQYLTMLTDKPISVFIEMDTSQNSRIPAVFIDCTECVEPVFTKLWAPDAKPPQWDRAYEICGQLPKDWELLYVGFMPGRTQSPLRLIFTRATVNEQHLATDIENVEELCKAIGYPNLNNDMKEKIHRLNELEFPEITICIDLMPDLSYGPVLGMEVMVLKEKTEPEETLNTPRGHALLQQLQLWQGTDDRINLLPQCCGIFFPPQLAGYMETQMQCFLNHVKLRWDKGTPLPAKAYIALNSYFR